MFRYACAVTDEDEDSIILTGGEYTKKVVARYNLQVGFGNIACCHMRCTG